MSTKYLLSFLFTIVVFSAYAQEPDSGHADITPIVDNRLPCQKNTDLPSFEITLVDSVSVFNTSAIKAGKKTAIVVFGPECSHCRDFFKQLFVGIDTLTHIDFYLVTPIRNFAPFRSFYYEMGIPLHKNIKAAGRDLNFFAMDFFGVTQFPYIILYDEHKKLVGGFGPGSALGELHN
ncbi:MAG: redoxin protein [Flavipsychrobacter sp.]|nr:redoxin protein [Flavipsychrobacter sp.]